MVRVVKIAISQLIMRSESRSGEGSLRKQVAGPVLSHRSINTLAYALGTTKYIVTLFIF